MLMNKSTVVWSRLTWLLLLAGALVLLLHPLSLAGSGGIGNHLVINEVELNPPGPDGTQGSEEWVELFNPTANDINVSDWSFSTLGGYSTITAMKLSDFVAEREGKPVSDYLVKAGGYLVLYLKDRQWLDNFDDAVLLQAADGREVDRTPLLTDRQDDDHSWQRIPNGQDTDTEIDWRFRQMTRGVENR